jgi:hypothetical protein
MGVTDKVAHQLFNLRNVTFVSVWTDAGDDTYVHGPVSNSRCLLDNMLPTWQIHKCQIVDTRTLDINNNGVASKSQFARL